MENKIKIFRAIKNLTQAELANLVWVRRETILFLEKWEYNPSLELAYKISKVFDTKIEEVFLFEK
jgi:putative transcriptional regulator